MFGRRTSQKDAPGKESKPESKQGEMERCCGEFVECWESWGWEVELEKAEIPSRDAVLNRYFLSGDCDFEEVNARRLTTVERLISVKVGYIHTFSRLERPKAD
jgi:hypothetical protein